MHIFKSRYRLFSRALYIGLFLVFLFISKFASSQGKQANNWYFGYHAGITFNNGSLPQAINGQTQIGGSGVTGSSAISDNDGNLLFYSDGVTIWNRNHVIMLNGQDMGFQSSQGAVTFQDPGNSNLYYYFNFVWVNSEWQWHLQYSIIDMTLDNGLGGVIPTKKSIQLLNNTTTLITAVRHYDSQSVWLLAHGLGTKNYYSFLITPDSLQTLPKVSNAGTLVDEFIGHMKLSPNGKKLGLGENSGLNYFFDILDFDNKTGIVNDANMVHKDATGGFGVEFSPDNSKFYTLGGSTSFFQYDLNAGGPQAIINSEVQLTNTPIWAGALQLGPDGKIYVGTANNYLGVINYPNIKGLACNFIENAIDLGTGYCNEGLPSFLQSYLNDPEFSTNQNCFNQPTQFTITNINGIDSVSWNFKDFGNMPNDTSTLFNPSYTFSAPGNYYPELTVWSGSISKTVKDTVVIYPLPSPNLGNDTLFCPDGAINFTLNVLNAGPGEQYFWNSNFSPGQPPSFLVSDTGYYRVRVKANGCSGNDTIHVGRYPEPLLVSPALPTPAHCGASDGSVTGAAISFGYAYTLSWKDGSGNTVGNALELQNVPSGAYTLEVIYGANCLSEFGPYIIQDIGGPEILSAVPTEDHCNQGLGIITITPLTGSVNDYSYSINGGPFVQNGGVFTGLTPDSYTVMIKDQFNCVGSYPSNPVVVQNIPGPHITNIIPVNETGGNGQGSITLYADGINLNYALNSGIPQSANYFGNLSAGLYILTVTDEYGCIKDTTVTLQNLQGNYLVAMAEGDTICLNAPANSGIRVSHVNGVKDLKATLSYDGSRLKCIYFNDSLPGITGMLYPALSQIVLQWHGDTPITSNDTITLGELIFETLQSGIADVSWQSPPGTVFTDENGDTIHPEFVPGIIQVHQVPAVYITAPTTLCQGDTLQLVSQITGGTDPLSWQWNTPQGINTGSEIQIENALPEHSGHYSFKVSDYFHCIDTADVDVTVVHTPTANFQEVNDTIWYEKEYRLEATTGYHSYQWSTGDTTYFINVTKEGEYSVMLQTEEGCENLESVMMMDGIVPIAVPNAFTPNGDGLNDSFKPVVNVELVKQFNMTIYNKWGQRLYETSNAVKGWDGKDTQPGVYSWVINYRNRVGKMFQMKGVVTVIR